jgi:AraC-like DNA-binding protein
MKPIPPAIARAICWAVLLIALPLLARPLGLSPATLDTLNPALTGLAVVHLGLFNRGRCRAARRSGGQG